MTENPEFMKLLEKMREIHSKKRDDYASVGFYENFTRQAEIISWFKADIDKAFASLIGVKLARLATLLATTRDPNFESVDDTFLDLATYAGLWGSYYAAMGKKEDLNSFVNTSTIQGDVKCRYHHWVKDLVKGDIFCDVCKMLWSEYYKPLTSNFKKCEHVWDRQINPVCGKCHMKWSEWLTNPQ